MSALEVGAELEPLVIPDVGVGPMKVMALLLQDPNPIHWDRASVTALGMGSRIVNQGPINVSWLAELAAHHAGGHANVKRLTARFVGQVHEGDRVVCRGTVSGLDATTATLELVAEVDGTPRVTATAVILR